MSTDTLAGLGLIAVPLAFKATFALLAARFDHPDVLRSPTAEGIQPLPRRRGRRAPRLHAHVALLV
jgi:hypothetical protein